MKDFVKSYFQTPFLVSLTVLLTFAGGVNYVSVRQGIIRTKEPLPMKEPFALLDDKLLRPYKVLKKSKIDNKDIIESLGTEEYLQWLLEDTTVDALSPVKNCFVFITYYTGNPDQVPHVPEACYTGGGSEVKEKFSVTFDIGDVNLSGLPPGSKIPATGLVFSQKSAEVWQNAEQFPVIYFFKVNGLYKGNRTATRIVLGDLTSKYSYFSKVELKFFSLKGFYPGKAEAITAAERLLKILLPVLERNHWPDWNEVNK
jgi:hypothetical protein